MQMEETAARHLAFENIFTSEQSIQPLLVQVHASSSAGTGNTSRSTENSAMMATMSILMGAQRSELLKQDGTAPEPQLEQLQLELLSAVTATECQLKHVMTETTLTVRGASTTAQAKLMGGTVLEVQPLKTTIVMNNVETDLSLQVSNAKMVGPPMVMVVALIDRLSLDGIELIMLASHQPHALRFVETTSKCLEKAVMTETILTIRDASTTVQAKLMGGIVPEVRLLKMTIAMNNVETDLSLQVNNVKTVEPPMVMVVALIDRLSLDGIELIMQLLHQQPALRFVEITTE